MLKYIIVISNELRNRVHIFEKTSEICYNKTSY